jgi:phosphopantothenoylcysteine decarboxylase/phosphopantothenate--cysteine ligase
VNVESSAEMADALLDAAKNADLVVMAAAVADYRPKSRSDEKIKKTGEAMDLELEPTLDILSAMRDRDLGGYRVGFAMETGQAESRAQAKLEAKGLDLIVANDLDEEGAGFGKDSNRVTVLGLQGFRKEYPLMGKDELGRQLLSLIAERAFGQTRGKANG